MRKSKKNEQLRERTRARAYGAGGGPAAASRTAKDALEVAREKCREMAPYAMDTLAKGMLGRATAQQLKAADSILDRAGLARTHSVEVSDGSRVDAWMAFLENE